MKPKKVIILIILLSALFLTVYLFSSGWIIPKEFIADRNDQWISKSWLSNLLIEPDSKITYHRIRKGWSDWELEGKYTIFYSDGSKFIEGQFKNGTWDGIETSWHKNGKKSGINYYQNGVHTGKSIYWDEDGNKIREVTYLNGQKNNEEIYWNTDGSLAIKNYWDKGKLIKVEFFKNRMIDKTLIGKKLSEYILSKLKKEQRCQKM